jgi:hypothetical protein
MGFPFHAQRRLTGLRLRVTDADWTVGSGPTVEGPIAPVGPEPWAIVADGAVTGGRAVVVSLCWPARSPGPALRQGRHSMGGERINPRSDDRSAAG